MPTIVKNTTRFVDSAWEAELNRVMGALRVVSNAAKSLNQVDDVVTWMKQVCQTAVDFGGYRMACIGLAEQDEEKTLRVMASAGADEGYFKKLQLTWADEPWGRGPAGRAIRTGTPCVARNIPGDPAFDPWRGAISRRGFKSSIALPLTGDGRVFGVLGMYADVVDAFGSAEVEVLNEMAEYVTFGLKVVLRTRAERQSATQALKGSEQKLAEAQRIVHVGHWERNLKTNIVKWSDELFRIFGLEPQPRGMPFEKIIRQVHEEDRARIRATIEEFVRTGRHYNVRFRIVRPEGGVRFLRSEGDVIRDDGGQIVGTFGIIQDITEWHEAEEALKNANRSLNEKNIALQEVLASVASEKIRIGRQISKNMQRIVLPMFLSLSQRLNRGERRQLEQIQHAMEEIVSPFVDHVSHAVETLSPAELRVCNFVRWGLAVKEIAEMEHLSPQTVAAHRRNIRRKLKISHQKINLATYLQTIFAEVPAQRAVKPIG